MGNLGVKKATMLTARNIRFSSMAPYHVTDQAETKLAIQRAFPAGYAPK